MSPFALNLLVLVFAAVFIGFLGLGLLWRVALWNVKPEEVLTEDYGLPVGAVAPELAGYAGTHDDQEIHLTFIDATTFLVFGAVGFQPCLELLRTALNHPATRHWQLVYAAGALHQMLDDVAEHREVLDRWRICRFHDETMSRAAFNAPVSPYFHVIDANGRVIAKGLGSRAEHLDRLLALTPTSLI